MNGLNNDINTNLCVFVSIENTLSVYFFSVDRITDVDKNC